MQKRSWQTFCQLRFLLKSTVKSSEPSIRLLSKVLYKTPLPLVYSTSTLIPTVAGLLRSSRVFCSKSSAMQTQSHKELVAERATSSSVLQTLHPPSPWQAFSITPLHSTLTLTLMTLVTPSLVFCKVSIVYTSILILLTSLPQTEPQATSTMSSVIRVLPLMTLVCSIAHMFPLQMVRAVGENLPTQDWIQDPLRSGCQPIRRRNRSRSGSSQGQCKPLLSSRCSQEPSCDPSFTCHQGPFGVLFYAYR